MVTLQAIEFSIGMFAAILGIVCIAAMSLKDHPSCKKEDDDAE